MTIDLHCASAVGKRQTESQDHFMNVDLRRQLLIRQSDRPNNICVELFCMQEGRLLVVGDGTICHDGGTLAIRVAIEESARYVLDPVY